MKVTADTITPNQIRILRLALRAEIEERIDLTHACADAIASANDYGSRVMLAMAWNEREPE
ncbi:MAG TPA: hypothetical protein VLN57_20890 [Xanthobacteraceae bacterium]|nr:hypothetical protein [Xanthobacteraceae bacterium]